MIRILIASLVLASASASAGQLYKCTDAKGVASYQQTPCPKAAKEDYRGYVAPQPDAPGLNWSNQVGRNGARQPDFASTSNDGYVPTQPRSGMSEAEKRAALSDLDSKIGAVGTPNTPSKREYVASLQSQKAAIISNGAIQPTPMTRQQQQQPVQRRDQYGNTYTQAPGSAFATDNKTGKQCFVNGAFVNCR